MALMNVIFFGAEREASYRAFSYILTQPCKVVACVCAKSKDDQMKRLCEKKEIPYYNDEQMYEELRQGRFHSFDLGICYLHPRILKKEIIEFGNNNIVNFHPAPTQVHRGVAACCYCLLKDYKEWAVTAHFITTGIDDGDIVLQRKFPLQEGLTGKSAEELIQKESLELLKNVVQLFMTSKQIPRIPQGTFQGTYYSRKQLEQDKVVDMNDTPDIIDHKIRAFWFPPYHGANIEIGGKKYSLVNEELLKELVAKPDGCTDE